MVLTHSKIFPIMGSVQFKIMDRNRIFKVNMFAVITPDSIRFDRFLFQKTWSSITCFSKVLLDWISPLTSRLLFLGVERFNGSGLTSVNSAAGLGKIRAVLGVGFSFFTSVASLSDASEVSMIVLLLSRQLSFFSSSKIRS